MEILVQDQSKLLGIARWDDDRRCQKGKYTSRSELDNDDSMVRFGTFSEPVLDPVSHKNQFRSIILL